MTAFEQMLALIDSVARDQESQVRSVAASIPPIDWTLNERSCWVPIYEDDAGRWQDDGGR